MNNNYAVVKNDTVENLMIVDDSQVEETEERLQCELVLATELGLQIGDLRVNGKWTRNVDGAQTELTERATYQELEEALRTLYFEMGVKEVES